MDHEKNQQQEQQKCPPIIFSKMNQNLRESNPDKEKLFSPKQYDSLKSGSFNAPKQITDSRGYSPHCRIENIPHKFSNPSSGEMRSTFPVPVLQDCAIYA